MGLPLYLALTAPELSTVNTFPKYLAYMACHFSSCNAGLSNFPVSLPFGSMLILNDSIPAQEHDPELICKQLADFSSQWNFHSILLDFQRASNELTQQIAAEIVHSLSCPVIVSDCYAQQLDCPVFLSAVPANKSLKKWLDPWHGREIWLEVALDTRIITVDKDGSRQSSANPSDLSLLPHRDDKLYCHYKIEPEGDQIQFTLQRTEDDLIALLQEAESLGVVGAVGLYQELGTKFHCN